MTTTPRIINTYDQLMAAMRAGHKWPYALCREYVGHRTPYFYGWKVYHPTKATDPSKSTSLSRGYRTFSRVGAASSDRMGREALAAAQQWVADTYGYSGLWKRNRMGDYVPADIQKQWPIPDRRLAGGLKVFGWQGHRTEAVTVAGSSRDRTREIMAVKSQAELLRLVGVKSAGSLRQLCETGNPAEVEAATKQPGVVLWHPLDERSPIFRT